MPSSTVRPEENSPAVSRRWGGGPRLLAALTGICVLAALLMSRVLVVWAGDAVIHLRIAELFAAGHPFQFNVGESVGATTSLFWTAVLTGIFELLEPSAVALAVKVIVVAAWYATVLCTGVCWARVFGNSWAGLAAGAAYALNPGVFHSAVSGMEAPLFALQVLLLFLITVVFESEGRWTPWAVAGLAVAATLTRPEGVIFCVLLAAFIVWRERGVSGPALALSAGVSVGLAATLLANLYATGSLMPDSGAARLAAGLRRSVGIGPIHAHPKSALLLAAYLPVSLGLALAPFRPGRPGVRRSHEGRIRGLVERLETPVGFAVVLTGVMLVFYTFVVGANHASRYWLPFYPFVFGAGCGAIVAFSRHHRSRRPRAAILVAGLCVAWLAGVYALDWNRRTGNPIGHPHGEVASAVRDRPQFTRDFLRGLDVQPPTDGPLRIAVTEVQLRYFLLDSVQILSLDGRTAKAFDRYVDPRTGLRRFRRYLREVRPDIVALSQLHPEEPVLPAVLDAVEAGEDVVTVDGFRFVRTEEPRYVRFVGE